MKSRLFILALIALCSCGGGYNPPVIPGGSSGNGSGTTQFYADFSYKVEHPFYVVFENRSSHNGTYHWNFGDGETSLEKNPIHKYSGKGVYKVTLTVHLDGHKTTYTQNVTIEAPTKCYVSKIKYESVPEYNEYYNIRCTDDYLLLETLYWYTNWTLLSTANLPYTYNIANVPNIDFSLSEYVIRLYKNSSTSGTGTQVKSWKLSTSEIKNKYSEGYILSGNNSKITVVFKWTD